jgi:hypothetical protein
MKNEFAFLCPPARALRFSGGSLDIRSLSFPLEVLKKYDFLFSRFRVPSRGRGLEIIFQDTPGRSGEAYAIDCEAGRVVLGANSPRGRFYALCTLLQVLAFHADAGRMPVFSLRDEPEVAWRGFFFPGEGKAGADAPRLQRLLLQLALLKFNQIALSSAAPAGVKDLARRIGMEVIFVDKDSQALFHRVPAGPKIGELPPGPAFFHGTGAEAETGSTAWLDFFLGQCRAARAGGTRIAAWGDLFLRRPEWIRRIPGGVLVLNREAGPGPGRGDYFKTVILPFKAHHVQQVLCPLLCERDRFLPDTRAAMARIEAAAAAVRTGKLAGIMLAAGQDDGETCLPEGAALLHFQAGCLLWSGRLPGPASFSRWALSRDEPDLFRVFSFLAQAEHRLPYSHCRYLFEDPLLAPYSRQGDPREIAAHFSKAVLYLKAREFAANEMSGFFDFTARLYKTIAAKVELSSRLRSFLEGAGGGETIRLQAAWLQQAVAELKELYAGLFGGPLPSRGLKEFDLLSERFAHLAQAASSPAGRETLLSALKNDSPLDSPEASSSDPYPM